MSKFILILFDVCCHVDEHFRFSNHFCFELKCLLLANCRFLSIFTSKAKKSMQRQCVDCDRDREGKREIK